MGLHPLRVRRRLFCVGMMYTLCFIHPVAHNWVYNNLSDFFEQKDIKYPEEVTLRVHQIMQEVFVLRICCAPSFEEMIALYRDDLIEALQTACIMVIGSQITRSGVQLMTDLAEDAQFASMRVSDRGPWLESICLFRGQILIT